MFNTNERYYRIMKNILNCKPYRMIVTNDNPLVLSKSTDGLSNPEEGDYIVFNSDGEMRIERPLDLLTLNAVEFETFPTLEELLNQNIVVEVSVEDAKKEFILRNDILDLDDKISNIEAEMHSLEREMTERKFGLLTKNARKAFKKYEELKLLVDAKRREDDNLRGDLDLLLEKLGVCFDDYDDTISAEDLKRDHETHTYTFYACEVLEADLIEVCHNAMELCYSKEKLYQIIDEEYNKEKTTAKKTVKLSKNKINGTGTRFKLCNDSENCIICPHSYGATDYECSCDGKFPLAAVTVNC